MENAKAKEIAAKIIDDNPRLAGIDADGRNWLINDIAGQLQNAYFLGRNDGVDVMAEGLRKLREQS